MRRALLVGALLLLAACHDESKMTAIDRERAHPDTYLKINYNFHKNLVGRSVVEGDVINTGSNITYYTINLLIECETKDHGDRDIPYTLHAPLAPGKSLHFKYKPGLSCESVKVTLKSAERE